jgi:hypothetical protein
MVDISVTVPYHRRQDLRNYAQRLNQIYMDPLHENRLRTALNGLKSMRSELADMGVLHAGIFGSVARGEDGPNSDIDVLIDINVDQVGDILDYIAICELIKEGLGKYCPGIGIDVADEKGLKPRIRAVVERDAVYAF